MSEFKLQHFILEKTNGLAEQAESIFMRICAQAIDMTDDAIVQTCIEVAREEGITDLYLLDKEFIANALKRALRHDKWTMVPSGGVAVYRCGNIDCARRIPFGHTPQEMKYCPYCGTEMGV